MTTPHRFLVFRNGNGMAVYESVQHSFPKKCPALPGMSFVEIEYHPKFHSMRRLRVCEDDDERDMTQRECEVVEAWLLRMWQINAEHWGLA